MKITCESCTTRYSIPDEKIQGAGRTFKIRCKSCGAMMTVKGVEGAGGEAPADVGAWYYAVGTDRKGPVTRDALSGLVGSGAVNAQTYVWKQGMANWTHLSEVGELADVLTGGVDDAAGESGDGDTAYMSRAEIMAAHSGYDPATGGDPAAAAAAAAAAPAAAPAAAAPAAAVAAPAAAAVAAVAAAAPAAEEEPDESTVAMAAPDAMVKSLFGDSAAASEPESADDLGGGESPFAAMTDSGASASASAGASSSFSSSSSASTSSGGGIFGDDDDDIFSFDSVEDESESPAGVHGRRDSSVLFSLDELASPGESSMSQEDAILTETSGLIDIRAVAKNQSTGTDDDDPFAKGSGVGMASAPSGFTAVSVPIVPQKKSKLPLIIVGVVVAAAAAVAIVLLTQKDPAPAPVANKVVEDSSASNADLEKAKAEAAKIAAQTAKIKAESEAEIARMNAQAKIDSAAAAAGAAAAKPATPDAKVEGADDSKAAGDATDPKIAKATTTKRKKPRAKSTTTTTKKPSDTGSTATVAPAPKPKTKVSGTSANALLNALDSKPKSSGTAGGGGGGGSGPKKLSAAQVRGKLSGAKGKFRACYKLMATPPPGAITVKLQVVISGTGSVKSARVVSGGGTSGAVQSCIVRAAKRVKFPSFRDSSMTVNYPIRLP